MAEETKELPKEAPLSIKRLFNKHYEFIKFSLVGASNTAISIIAYNLLLKIGILYLVASSLAYGIGMINSYLLNKIWVFESKISAKKTIPKFLLVNLVSLSITNFLLYLNVSVLGLNKALGQLIVTVTILIINFLGSKLWIFKNQR
jgi:putative flippase GtrA